MQFNSKCGKKMRANQKTETTEQKDKSAVTLHQMSHFKNILISEKSCIKQYLFHIAMFCLCLLFHMVISKVSYNSTASSNFFSTINSI